MNQSTDIRPSVNDRLALSRTQMANERTLLAYFRTGMTMIITGAGIIKFVEDGWSVLAVGAVLIMTGIGYFVWGLRRFRKNSRHFLTIMPGENTG